jgi:hypothetical protein
MAGGEEPRDRGGRQFAVQQAAAAAQEVETHFDQIRSSMAPSRRLGQSPDRVGSGDNQRLAAGFLLLLHGKISVRVKGRNYFRHAEVTLLSARS